LFDLLFQGLFLLLLALTLPILGSFGVGLLLIFIFLIQWLYPVFFEIYKEGQTPGKKIMQLQVLMIDGTMVNWGASLLRNLLRTVDFLPFMYAFGVATILLSRDFRRLGDLAANTIVVYKRELKQKKTIPEAKPFAAKVILTAKEQQIIVSYAERINDFSPERAEELARFARPLLHDLALNKPVTDKVASHRLLEISSYLVGRR
jgi:uncharacterized RDD family membrane protein YckC